MTKRWTTCAAIVVGLVLAFQVAGHGQAAGTSDLRAQLAERYDLVPLQRGVALVPRESDGLVRMIQIVDGVVSVDGESLTGQQLRDRLGADADLVLQVSYLTLPQQRDLAGAPGAPVAPPSAPAPPPAPPIERSEIIRGDRVRFGGDVVVSRNERLEGEVVAMGGSVTIDGEVTGDAVSIGGTLTLGPEAVVRGDAVSVGGGLVRAPGARVDGDVTEVGAGGAGFRRGWWFPAMFGTFSSRLGSLAATMVRLTLLALIAVVIVAFGRGPVERIAARMAEAPVRSGLIGLLAEILFLPVLVLTVVFLAVSIVGIPLLVLVPFGILLLMLVALVGFVALAYHVGRKLTDRFGWTERGAYAAVAIGVVAIGGLTLAGRLGALAGGVIVGAPLGVVGYLVEYVAWTAGFGAAILYWYENQPRFGSRGPAPAAPQPTPGEA